MFKIGDKVRHVRCGIGPGEIVKKFRDNRYLVRWKTWHGECVESADVLIPDGPVREVTRREIVPGTYGKVRVTEGGYIHCKSIRTAEELRDAIATLEQIAEAWSDAH